MEAIWHFFYSFIALDLSNVKYDSRHDFTLFHFHKHSIKAKLQNWYEHVLRSLGWMPNVQPDQYTKFDLTIDIRKSMEWIKTTNWIRVKCLVTKAIEFVDNILTVTCERRNVTKFCVTVC